MQRSVSDKTNTDSKLLGAQLRYLFHLEIAAKKCEEIEFAFEFKNWEPPTTYTSL